MQKYDFYRYHFTWTWMRMIFKLHKLHIICTNLYNYYNKYPYCFKKKCQNNRTILATLLKIYPWIHSKTTGSVVIFRSVSRFSILGTKFRGKTPFKEATTFHYKVSKRTTSWRHLLNSLESPVFTDRKNIHCSFGVSNWRPFF